MQSPQASERTTASSVGWGAGGGPEVRYGRAEALHGVAGREVEDQTTWERLLRSPEPLHNLRLQGLDLTVHRDLLLARDDISDVVVLGGRLDPGVEQHLRRRRTIIFPPDPRAPVDPYRARLYTAQELYEGLGANGYGSTVDARAYRWSQDGAVEHDAYVSVLRAIHDDAMADALSAVVTGGGPGAMEAANLGAWAPDEPALRSALDTVQEAEAAVLGR